MQCPGQDNRYWGGSEVFDAPCPHCGNEIEFFKDDSQRTCGKCGHKVLNPKIDFGCASYCQHAEQCLGSLPPEILAQQGNLFKNRLAIQVKKLMADDPEGYILVEKRAELGEAVCREEDGNMPAILASAILSKVEDPLEILKKMGAKESLVEEVDQLLNNTPAQSDAEELSRAIFHDACLLADLATGTGSSSNDQFLTQSGKEQAKEL